MFAYCGNSPLNRFDPSGNIYKEAFDQVDTHYPNPWQHTARGGGSSIAFSYIPARKTIDITNKLNYAMLHHAYELSNYLDVYGGPSAVLYFIMKVNTGGDWDLKSQKDWLLSPSITYIYDGKELAYDDIGNIHYGFIGMVLFPEELLLIAGGLVQIASRTSSIMYYDSNFDDPRDQLAIRYGISLWEGGLKWAR